MATTKVRPQPTAEQASAADVKRARFSLGGEIAEARAAAWLLKDLDGGGISMSVPGEHADWLRAIAIDALNDALARAENNYLAVAA